ncbi:MAG: DUF126 domain-containing protein [Thermodesulfobacteriota bacterium]
MSTPLNFKCHKIAEGRARAKALVSPDAVCFYLVDPQTGVIIEEGHGARGRSVAGQVLVFPSGKGSSVVQADGLYQLKMNGCEPKAMIIRHPDTVLVATAIIMGVPLVDGLDEAFYREIADGDEVEVDSDGQRVTLYKN